eukprot:2027824-Rhodomonas_salina.1
MATACSESVSRVGQLMATALHPAPIAANEIDLRLGQCRTNAGYKTSLDEAQMFENDTCWMWRQCTAISS